MIFKMFDKKYEKYIWRKKIGGSNWLNRILVDDENIFIFSNF
jgi:hypothetical protein